MSDRILIPVSAELAQKLNKLVEPGDQTALDAIVDAALDGDPASWDRELTIETTPAEPGERPQSAVVLFCKCCAPGICKNQLHWRGITRCACVGEEARPPGAGRPMVVQPNLER